MTFTFSFSFNVLKTFTNPYSLKKYLWEGRGGGVIKWITIHDYGGGEGKNHPKMYDVIKWTASQNCF